MKLLKIISVVCLLLCIACSACADGASTYAFDLNYDDAAPFAEGTYDDGSRIKNPGAPERDGFYFAGWFEDSDCTSAYNDLKKYSGNVTFYANWLKMYTFEAENTQLTDLDPDEDDTCNVVGNKVGQGYSGNVSGTGLIGNCTCEASGNAYLTNLYYNGAFVEFVINADQDVDNALLFLRLTCEFKDMYLTDKTFVVTVNDEEIAYGEINLIGGSMDDLTNPNRRTMTNHGMGNISLKKGENIIRLTVNNAEKQFPTGTMDAAAPMIDCIMIYANADLTMEEYDN